VCDGNEDAAKNIAVANVSNRLLLASRACDSGTGNSVYKTCQSRCPSASMPARKCPSVSMHACVYASCHLPLNVSASRINRRVETCSRIDSYKLRYPATPAEAQKRR